MHGVRNIVILRPLITPGGIVAAALPKRIQTLEKEHPLKSMYLNPKPYIHVQGSLKSPTPCQQAGILCLVESWRHLLDPGL